MMRIEVDASKVLLRYERMPVVIRTAIRGEVVSLTQQLAAKVRENLSGRVLNKRSGALYNSIRSEMVENPQTIYGRVYVDPASPAAKYAAAHEFGVTTRPHVITARNAAALAFMMNGRKVFFKRVNHPGSKIPERSYMRSALAELEPQIVARFVGVMTVALAAAE